MARHDLGREDVQVTKTLASRLREREANTFFKWVKGHSNNEGNDGADILATEGLNKEDTEDVTLKIPPELDLRGAKLSKMTQALAYKAIRNAKHLKSKSKAYQRQIVRKRTARMISKAKIALEEMTGRSPSENALWRGTGHKDFSKTVRNFMWMALHDAYKIGDWWLGKSPEVEGRATCGHCDEIESMEHILLECETPGQARIWKLVQKIWEGKKSIPFPTLSIGSILACSTAELKDTEGNKDLGASRLFRILISEATHLIWKLRNERVIPKEDSNEANEPASKREIKNRFKAVINGRLHLDQKLATRGTSKSKLPPGIVYQTWRGVLHNEKKLPDEWIGETGVLVGMAL